MKTSAALKMMSLAGALVSIGVFAADDSRTKDMNKGKADASFVEQAAMSNVSEIKMSELAVSQSTNTSVRELAQQLIDDHTKAFESLKQISDNKGIMLPFDSVGSSGTTGSQGSMGTGGTGASQGSAGSVGDTGSSRGTGNTGTNGNMGSNNNMGSNKGSTGSSGSMGSSGTGSSDTTGSDRMGSSGSAGDVPAAEPSVSDPAASGERMGSGDRMNTESKNVYGQLSSEQQKKYDELAKLTGDKFDKKYLGTIIDAHKKAIKEFEKESKSGQDSELKSYATNTLPTLKHHLDMAQSVESELRNAKKPSM